ncbi:MAG: FAD-dependent monooxygenase [Actinobacteria bacterium]|nr:FAD-dependent monooxygenase [Actinomycetota bacterium]
MTTGKRLDVVVVGGGIAGSALATVLARDGYEVLVLERQTTYRDKVRGEVINCWGVAELLRLDLEKPLLDAGGSYADRFVSFDETIDPADAEAAAVPLDQMLPGIPGVLDVGHPEACEALTRAAEAAGATVVRGVGDVLVTSEPSPTVHYEHDDVEHEISCRLVAGADGRQSTVRRQLGIRLMQTTPRTLGGGLLVDDLYAWPANRTSIGTEGGLHYLIFPRAAGRARLYLLHDIAQKGRFAGPDRHKEFLAAYQFRCIPGSEMFGAARPAGPCAFYPSNDSWTETPYVPGAVLLGDAASWNDPIIGQGLSIALRDVRMVSEILRSGSDWSPTAFEPYGEERRERMRRLRLAARIRTDITTTFTQDGATRRKAYNRVWRTDPVLGGTRLAVQLGPEKVAAEAFEPEAVDRILTLT